MQGENETPKTEQMWLNDKKAAQYLDIKLKTFRNYVSRKAIPCHQNPVTGTRRFLKTDLDAWMRGGL